MSKSARKMFVYSTGLLVAVLVMGTLVFLAAHFSATVVSADNGKTLKIGVVNLQAVLKKYARSLEFQGAWEAKRNEIEKALMALEEELTTKKRKLGHTLRSTESYAELYREITFLRQRLEFDSEYLMKQHYNQGEMRQREIFADIEIVIKAYSAEKGFTAVLMSQELPAEVREKAGLNSYFQDVMYYDSSIDISSAIIERLNAASSTQEPPKKNK